MLIRIDKMLSNMSYGSRKQVKDIISKGSVVVDGAVVKDSGYIIDTDRQELYLNGKLIEYKKYVYIMMNKPKGVISAREDARGQLTANDLLDDTYKGYKVSCAGRLDIDTEGLLLLSNDGEFIHNIISPKKEIVKKYFCNLISDLSEADVIAFEKGIELADGVKCLPAKLEILDQRSAFVYLMEGKFHQVKKMFLARRNKVIFLKRVKIGNLELDRDLKPGEYKELNQEEIDLIFN